VNELQQLNYTYAHLIGWAKAEHGKDERLRVLVFTA
jgi:hypothetical protein